MNDFSILCPMCGEGQLVEHTHERHYKIEGLAYVVSGLRHSLCSHCGEDITTPDQSRHNKRVIIEARDRAVAERDAVQRLTPADILRIRKTLGLTQVQAARVFGGGPNAFGKYENAEVAPSDGMEKLLRLADQLPEAATWLMRRAGLPAPSTTPCSREKDCVVLKRLLMESFHASLPVGRGIMATEFASLRVSASEAHLFTYSAAGAANDTHTHTRLELAAVG
jgi:HTH-type transcriptional regulator/antitoxin MqsA